MALLFPEGCVQHQVDALVLELIDDVRAPFVDLVDALAGHTRGAQGPPAARAARCVNMLAAGV